MTFNPANTVAPYLQTSIFFPDNFEEFRVKFLDIYRDISNNVNIRQIAVFDQQEFLAGEQWFTTGNPQKKRQTFRKVFEFTDASLTFNHGITGIVLCTHIYGSFTNGTNFYPLPYVSAGAITDQVQVVVTPTQVVVTKGGTAPAITNAVLILEYLKNQMLEKGVEPSTARLQVECSTN